jgi:predicted alternative tryptophan synthase beta-subunit
MGRQAAREQLGSLLSTALVGTGKLAQAVYDYRIGDFAGLSPVVTVSSRGSIHPPMTVRGLRGSYRLQVDTFVAYAATGWTEADSEDALDAIEAVIAGVIAANPTSTAWNSIDYDAPTERADVEVGGIEYAHEQAVFLVEVYA